MAIKRYILQIADDTAFTMNLNEQFIAADVSPLEYLETGLSPETTRYGRYRAEDFGGNLSPWSAIASATTDPPTQPGDIASIWAYYEADSYSQADGSNITTNWTDKSGNARHATVTGTPTFETNELNGQPIIRLGADSNDYFTVPSMSALTAGTAIFVLKLTDTTTNGSSKFGTGSTPHYPFSPDGLIYDDFGSTARKDSIATVVTLANTWHRLRIHSAAGDWGMYQNGSTLYTTGSNTVGFSTTPRIGFNGSSNYWKADLAAVYLFSAKLTSGEIADMNAYIQAKYGV